MAWTCMIKYSTNLVLVRRSHMPQIVILAKFMGVSAPAQPTNIVGVDARVNMDFMIEEQREALKMSTQYEVTHTTVLSVPSPYPKLVGTSTLPPHPSLVAATTSMVLVSHKFLHILVEIQRVTTTQIENVEVEVASLYGKIWPQVWMTLEATKTILQATYKFEILEF